MEKADMTTVLSHVRFRGAKRTSTELREILTQSGHDNWAGRAQKSAQFSI
jgi:hypothetical protein